MVDILPNQVSKVLIIAEKMKINCHFGGMDWQLFVVVVAAVVVLYETIVYNDWI